MWSFKSAGLISFSRDSVESTEYIFIQGKYECVCHFEELMIMVFVWMVTSKNTMDICSVICEIEGLLMTMFHMLTGLGKSFSHSHNHTVAIVSVIYN